MDLQPLPFTAKFQSGLLSLLLHDYEFLRTVIEELDHKHFDAGEAHIKLFKLIFGLWKQLKQPITEDIVKNTLHKLQQSGSMSDGIAFGIQSILEIGLSLSPPEKAYIKENCVDFIRKQTIALAFGKAINFFEKNDFDTMYSIMGDAYKRTFSMGATLGSDYFKTSVFDLYSQPPRKGIWSSGFETFDSYISGGFAKKECVSVLSPTGRGKCLGKNTPIIMSNGNIKLVQDIKVGELLMGPDGKSRRVLSVTSGYDNLYKVTPVKGDSYIVNSVHLLSLKTTANRDNLNLADGQVIRPGHATPIFIQAKDFVASNKTVKHCLKAWRPGPVSFELPERPLEIPPYILGVWLGDGSSDRACITQVDNEVVTEFKQYAASIGTTVTEYTQPDRCSQWYIYGKSTFKTSLNSLNLINNKHIPQQYKLASIKSRLELLAGLLDTDGHLKADGSGYEFIQKSKSLAEDVLFLCRSLGLAAYMSECEKSISSREFSGTYYRLTIYGDCEKIPVRVAYKKASPRKQKKNHLLTSITVEPAGYGEYFGFEIDGDRQFLLGDWQVTHNTALLCNFAASALRQGLNVSFVTLEMSENIIQQRTDAILSGASIDMIASNTEIQQDVLKQRMKLSNRGASYVVKYFPRGTLSIEALTTYYDRYAMNYGHYPDVAIVDWLGCLKLSGDLDKKHEALGEAADGLINLAVANEMSMITSQQTNRSAVGSDTFGYNSVSASFESLFGMDMVLSLGASDKAKDAGKRTLGLLKNRFGPDSVNVPLLGNRPGEVMNFRFEEAPAEDEEADLITP